MSSEDNAPVRITNRELYDLLQENLTLSRETRQIVEGLSDKQKDHEERLREVERARLADREEARVFKGRVSVLGTVGVLVIAPFVSAIVALLLK